MYPFLARGIFAQQQQEIAVAQAMKFASLHALRDISRARQRV
jgi:hypothetical protein